MTFIRYLLGLLVLILVLGCGPQQADLPIAPSSEPSHVEEPHDADFSLTVERYLREFETDEKAAHAKYGGKTVELSGVVDDVGRKLFDYAFVELQQGGDTPRSVPGVLCATIDTEPWGKVVPGQRIKIKGQYQGGIGWALSSCVFVEIGPSPAIMISAADLASEYSADPEAVRKKYTGKWLIVNGEIVAIRAYSEIVMNGDGKAQVVCDFLQFKVNTKESLFKPSWMDEMKPGRKARVLVNVDPASFDPGAEVRFTSCLPITGSGERAPSR